MFQKWQRSDNRFVRYLLATYNLQSHPYVRTQILLVSFKNCSTYGAVLYKWTPVGILNQRKYWITSTNFLIEIDTVPYGTDQKPSTGMPNSILEATFYVLGEAKGHRFF